MCNSQPFLDKFSAVHPFQLLCYTSSQARLLPPFILSPNHLPSLVLHTFMIQYPTSATLISNTSEVLHNTCFISLPVTTSQLLPPLILVYYFVSILFTFQNKIEHCYWLLSSPYCICTCSLQRKKNLTVTD